MSHSVYTAPLAHIDREIAISKAARAFAVEDAVESPVLTNLLLLEIARALTFIAEQLNTSDV